MTQAKQPLIFHLALEADWDAAKTVGEYRISGRGMSLAVQGFIHCCYADQVAGVADRYWRGVGEPVLLLTIDPARLDDPVVAENTGGGIELFPHLYGPLPVAAVLAEVPLGLDEAGDVVVPDRVG